MMAPVMVATRTDVGRTGCITGGLCLHVWCCCGRRIDRRRAGNRKSACDNRRSDQAPHDQLPFLIAIIG
jgi:hypothetical protein